MALSSYWVSQNRKDLAERAIVAKREKDAARAEKLKVADSYHRDIALKTSKYRNIEELQGLKSARSNEESSVKEKLKYDKKEKLENRRRRLAYILSVENDQYMKELQEMKDNQQEINPWNISILKEQIADLQKKRKEGEQSIQKKYMQQAFNSTIGFANGHVNQQLQKEVEDAWKKRKEELEKLSIEKREKCILKLKTMEMDQLKAIQEAQDIEKVQMEEQKKWSDIIKKKMDDFKSAENETKKLKVEKQILTRYLETLLSLQHRRTSVRDLKKKALQRLETMRQPKEKLRRMHVEVFHSLDFDQKQMVTILAFNGLAIQDSSLTLLDLGFVADLKKKLDMQRALEKEREAEIQRLYTEEAEKYLKTQMELWSLESIARDELMNELYIKLAKEINSKMELNVEEEKKFISMKETYVKEIDEASKQAKECIKTLAEKQEYHLVRAKKLNDELLFLSDTKSIESRPKARPSSSRGKSTFSFS